MKTRYLVEWWCMCKSVPWTEVGQKSRPPSIVKSAGQTWIIADDEESACDIQALVINHSTAHCKVIQKENITNINENQTRKTENRKEPKSSNTGISRYANKTISAG